MNPMDGPVADEIDELLGVHLPAHWHVQLGATAALTPAEAKGRLQETGFGLLLGTAFRRAFSGTLHLRSAQGDATIWFSAGLPVDVAPPAIAPGTRVSATAATVERWFLELANWDAGFFAFDAGITSAGPSSHRIHALRHPAALFYESLLRRAEDETLKRWRGDRNNRLRLRWPLAMDVVMGLEADLRVAVRLFDGGRSFAEVVKGSRQDEGRLLRAAFLLFCFGVLAPAGDDPSAGSENDVDVDVRADRDRIEALFKLADDSDYFAFLGVDRQSSGHEVLTACDRLAREVADANLNPDVSVATGKQRSTIEMVLSEARRVLGDDAIRVRYRTALVAES